ncbi:MAG: acyl-CoA thioesterase, partial [Gemmatimonadetes bacterium]|nr:acyl-CoA thioesterase [Gemmatimonadota bacterium]NIO32569.1 acyl-CoA thioesterase [Gemmatimonadota bacterium]
MGVVYHTNYLIWCEMGRTELMRQLGATYAELEQQGVYLVVSRAQIRFRNSAGYDDPVRVRTRLTRVRSRG